MKVPTQNINASLDSEPPRQSLVRHLDSANASFINIQETCRPACSMVRAGAAGMNGTYSSPDGMIAVWW
jgi:hypothetical protein